MMMRRCGVCGQLFHTINRLLTHVEARHTEIAVWLDVELGVRNDWKLPDNPDGFVLPTHTAFMTGNFDTHPAFTWRAQLPALLAALNVELEGGIDA